MSILNKKVSKFRTTKDTYTELEITIEELLNDIKKGKYKESIEKIRLGDDLIKTQIPTVSVHGVFNKYRKKDNFTEASGLIIIDIDDVTDELEDIKLDIMETFDNVLTCFISPSGNGIKALYLVDEELVTADNYRKIGKQVSEHFKIYGTIDVLSITDCLIVSYDPKILVNENVVPDFIYIQDDEIIKGELEEFDSSKTLWDDVEDFFDTVLANSIAEKTNNNYHFIQVAVLDLKKFGFEHPKDDLSFVIDYAEEQHKQSPKNKHRFLEVVEVAKKYPQIKWAYRTGFFDEDEQDDEYTDYSEFIDDYKKNELKMYDGEGTDEKTIGLYNDDDDFDGFIDYDSLFDKVLSRAREGDRIGAEISLKNFSEIFRFKDTGILTVTGIPSSGKTEFTDACILDLARLHNQDTIFAGFEQTAEEHMIKLIRKIVGTNVTCPSWLNDRNMPEFKNAYEFCTKHFRHIDVRKVGGNINTILTHTASKIKEMRDNGGNPKYVVLDPFNMLSIKGKFSGHEKIEEILRRISHFSHKMDVLVILVAHPFKMRVDEKTGEYAVPDFYSVKGSSAFFEMSYHGLVVYRKGFTRDLFVRVLKVKQSNLGTAGEEANFSFDINSTRYIPLDGDGEAELAGDHYKKDWINFAKTLQDK